MPLFDIIKDISFKCPHCKGLFVGTAQTKDISEANNRIFMIDSSLKNLERRYKDRLKIAKVCPLCDNFFNAYIKISNEKLTNKIFYYFYDI